MTKKPQRKVFCMDLEFDEMVASPAWVMTGLLTRVGLHLAKRRFVGVKVEDRSDGDMKHRRIGIRMTTVPRSRI